MASFDYDFLEQLKEHNIALKLLRSPHFPLLGSFFYQVFIQKNRRSVNYQELVALLTHHLADINESYQVEAGVEKYPKSAKAYIDDWISQRGGYLRKYLPPQGDEPECDLLPDVEKALRWLEGMQGKSFVGTESRLKLLLELIADLVHGTSEDQSAKLATLEQRKAELEQQIERVKQGIDAGYSATQVREKVYLITDMSRQLMGDFRQVEANFRELDKETRKKITLSGAQKGTVLDAVFGDQDIIDESDQGKSFGAFFELLMHSEMRNNMRGDLNTLLNSAFCPDFANDDELLQHLYSYLLDAGNSVNSTKQQITDQLRRYIQEQSQDNKRILSLIRDFESATHHLSQQQAEQGRPDFKQDKAFTELDSFQAMIAQQLSRQLYQPKQQESLDSAIVENNPAPDIDLSRLLEVSHINEQQLRQQIASCLQQLSGQATLAQVIESYPIQYGLDELLTYVKMACEQEISANINDQVPQQISWQVQQNNQLVTRQVQLPTITFIRD
ncbi:DUF3375 domain-containing protein [Thalassotalea euphylliae]|uniref:DUF3375 domain-containing protein n=1 Tax=Thalassotalea euphylliae TaxID=1655234 RepID=A0A3E0TMV9_9GAMM|nr:DUF3375 domain-containing protein [Thalassotalea euphylliae]REL25365.1 DUF3375 domain-containing protein [Thalassotalea euphylliae]